MYIITDFQGPEEGLAYFLRGGSDYCNPECSLFRGSYTEDGCFDDSNEPCTDVHSYLPDLTTGVHYPFNCLIPNGSDFKIRFVPFDLSLPNCVAGTNRNDISITFQIICAQTELSEGCLGYSYVSDPITMNGPQNLNVSLENFEECGCFPTIN